MCRFARDLSFPEEVRVKSKTLCKEDLESEMFWEKLSHIGR